VATLLAAAAVVFLTLDVLPGDPAAVVLGTGARPDTLAALRAQMGLDQPLLWRFATWLGRLATGDLGRSVTYGTPVAQLIAQRIAVTAPLALAASALATVVGLPLGVLAAARRGRVADRAIRAASQVGLAVPNFWLGLLLVLLFSGYLGWLPAGGFGGWSNPLAAGRALLLPAVALALPQAAVLARVARGATLETLQADYVRTARARGLSRSAALWRHSVPNALGPILTIWGLQLAFLLAGAVIVENVFSLPGLGRLLFQSLTARDLVVVEDLVLLLVAVVVVVNAVIDALQLALDPRLRSA